jgi:methyl-accepting chemotaxis protein
MAAPPVKSAPGVRTTQWKPRRRWLVKPEMQRALMASVVEFAGLLALLVLLIVFWPMHAAVDRERNPEIRALLDDQVVALHIRLWACLLIAGGLMLIRALLTSNRIAGPISRIEQIVQDMSAGTFTPFRIRHDDLAGGLETQVNALGYRVRALAKRNQETADSIRSSFDSILLRTRSQTLTEQELQRLVAMVKAELASLADFSTVRVSQEPEKK